MRLRFAACAAIPFLSIAGAASAQQIPCGGTYAVQRGDLLQSLAERAYGPEGSYVTLHRANRNQIGRNPSQIEVGMRLLIPCPEGAALPISSGSPRAASESPARQALRLDEMAPEAAATPPQTRPAAEVNAIPEPHATKPRATAADDAARPVENAVAPPPSVSQPAKDVVLRIVTAAGRAPFPEADSARDGLTAELVRAALDGVEPTRGYKIDVVNDWGAHLRPLLTGFAYDLSFPWPRPDCDHKDRLSADSRQLCEGLLWSDPIYEQTVGYYTRAGATPPESPAALRGQAICRPEDVAQVALEAQGLAAPGARFVTPDAPADCFALLLDGTVDAVAMATTTADNALRALPDAGAVEEQPKLASTVTLHAVATPDNARAAAQLSALNEGLKKIRENGLWFEIVERQLASHAETRASH